MKARTVKTLYGNIALFRIYCKSCRQMSFVIDGILQCCEVPLKKPESYIAKRESETEHKRKVIPQAIRDAVLSSQHGRCIYCDCDLMKPKWDAEKVKYIKHQIHFDHLIPWSHNGCNQLKNIVAACSECNMIKSSLIFDSLEEAQIYILTKRGLT